MPSTRVNNLRITHAFDFDRTLATERIDVILSVRDLARAD